MASTKFNSKSPTIKRILREASELSTHPSPDYHAAPASDSNLFDWHFTLRGPPSSPFAEGIYHGRIVLPPTYPLRPPSFRFLTPSGRFEVNREICLSISGHHEETWQPAWGIRTALVALRAFMETDAKGQLGGMESGEKMRRELARNSKIWRCGVCGKTNLDVLDECRREWEVKQKEGGGEGEGEDVKVPEELRLGFKDEMGKGKGKELEGGRIEEGSAVQNAYPPARPAQGAPQPTPTITRTAPQTHRAHVRPGSNEGVPAWVDRAIALVGACLVFMIVKMFLGY